MNILGNTAKPYNVAQDIQIDFEWVKKSVERSLVL